MTERSRKGKTEAKNKLAKVPNTIYNVELERKLTTEYNLKLLIQEIGKLEARKNRVSVKTVVDTVRKGFKVQQSHHTISFSLHHLKHCMLCQ